ncbi:DNA N-6-adenine-methyltransferase [Methanoregula sp.]|jgi:site-specific DNA-methyltransferase (adenine-specific)|uniref:DNA N-6-adenine-methyltransferase n=1 Tax=Methanoregula sp. TaxID=2052170 RepID=UPI003565C2BE
MSHQRKSKIVTPKDEWGTPQWLFDLLDQEYKFLLDPAASIENAKGKIFITEGSLEKDWFGMVKNTRKLGFGMMWECPAREAIFLNPPYSAGNIDRFMQKAYEESQKGAVVVCLVPSATDTRWWHNYAMKAQEIRFIKGRVRFVGYDEEGKEIRQSPTFSSCVVIFGSTTHPGMSTPYIGPTIEQPRSAKA